MPKYGVFFGPEPGKYGPENISHLDTFHAVNKSEKSNGFYVPLVSFTAQKMKFSIKDFFSKCDQIRRELVYSVNQTSLSWMFSWIKNFTPVSIIEIKVIKFVIYLFKYNILCYRNQSTNLQCKPITCFLYNGDKLV